MKQGTEKKRKQVVAWFLIMILTAGTLAGCTALDRMDRYEVQYLDLFDTVTTIIAYSESQQDFNEKAAVVYKELKTYHQLYDIYNSYEGINNLKTINDMAGKEPVKVDEKIIELLVFAKEMYKETNGKTNAACGSVLSVWHKYRTEGLENPEYAKLPSMEELEAAGEHMDMNKVVVDVENSTVYLEDGNMSLDVGSIGKGFAAQRVGELAKEIGLTSFLLSVGGNIVTEGTRADGSSWQLGIQNPDTTSSEAYVEKVALSGETLVTSGNYQRYYMVDGRQYHHIINLDTLMPADYFASVSIITEDSGMADALSTAVFNMSLEDGQEFVEGFEHTEAMWILQDGTKVYTEGFGEYIVK